MMDLSYTPDTASYLREPNFMSKANKVTFKGKRSARSHLILLAEATCNVGATRFQLHCFGIYNASGFMPGLMWESLATQPWIGLKWMFPRRLGASTPHHSVLTGCTPNGSRSTSSRVSVNRGASFMVVNGGCTAISTPGGCTTSAASDT